MLHPVSSVLEEWDIRQLQETYLLHIVNKSLSIINPIRFALIKLIDAEIPNGFADAYKLLQNF